MAVGHPGRKSVEKRLDLDSLSKESAGVADNVEGERKKGRQRGWLPLPFNFPSETVTWGAGGVRILGRLPWAEGRKAVPALAGWHLQRR